MKETKKKDEKELKEKVMRFLVDEWEHNVPLEKLKDPQHITKVIKWIQKQQKQQQ